jgi:hypothetical protein
MQILAVGLTPAAAASAKVKVPKSAPTAYASSTAPAVAEPAETASVGRAATKPSYCQTSRRKLWVEGDGWIVRRVTTCF